MSVYRMRLPDGRHLYTAFVESGPNDHREYAPDFDIWRNRPWRYYYKHGFCPPQQALRKLHWESDFIISCLISNLTWMCKSQNSSCKEEMQVNTSMGSFYSSWMMWGPISTYRVTMNPHTKPDPVHILIRNWIFKPIFRHIINLKEKQCAYFNILPFLGSPLAHAQIYVNAKIEITNFMSIVLIINSGLKA